MKTYFNVSDIHGEYKSLIEALDAAGYDKNNENHWLISAGDLFDRGFQNVEVYEFFKNTDRKLMILGNHDEFLLDFLSGAMSDFEWNCEYNGLWETLQSFAGLPATHTWHYWAERKLELRHIIMTKHPELQEFLKSMVNLIKMDNLIITHAGFRKDHITERWLVDNFSDTEKFIQFTQDKFPEFIFLFGHWHAFRLHRKFYDVNDYFQKFEYKNYIGIDACSNVFMQVFVHKIEFDKEPEIFDGRVSIEFLQSYDKLETLWNNSKN